MKVIIATGGTGGHIYPAISLANAIVEKHPSSEILFIGSDSRMEKEIIPAHGYSFYGLNVISTAGSIIHKVKSLWLLKKAQKECKGKIEEFKPDIVIGFGNYISIPVLFAARKKKVKTMIHEQNSIVGKANKMLSRQVDAIVGCYEENKKSFPILNTKILGNPRSSDAALMVKDDSRISDLGLNPEKLSVLFVMGSLGSSSVNEILKKSVKEFKDKEYQVIIATGKQGYESFVEGLDCPSNVKVVPYVNGIEMMKQVDVVVTRGGATTAAEIAAIQVPSIIIPSPFVPHDHQTKNAQALVDAKAALMLKESEMNVAVLISKIESILFNKKTQEEMKESLKNISKPNANKEIIQWIEELVYESK